MKLQALVLASILTGAVATPPSGSPGNSGSTETNPGVTLGGDCTVWFNANAGGPSGGGAWKKYKGSADYDKVCAATHTDGTPLSCVPTDTSLIEDTSGWLEIAGTCALSQCEGYDDTDGIDVDNLPVGEDPGTRRVTICHRTCSQNNPWVRITIDYHAFEADNGACTEDGNDHTRHDVAQDCNGYSGDYEPWGYRTEDYLIRYHGSRAEVATNWTNGGTFEGFDSEMDYWAYWERACPSVRANKPNGCCSGEDCCGYVAPTPDTTPTPPITPNDPPTPVPPPTDENSPPSPTPGSNGDPHFKTWKNEHYEYHGQCDMVLTKDANFASGLGLDIQIRTKMVRFWSYIRNAAVRIGHDVIELEGSDDLDDQSVRYWYNMEFKAKDANTLGGFPMTIKRSHAKMTKVIIDLDSKYPGVKIVMSTYKEFVRVDVQGPTEEAFGSTVGLLGEFTTGKTLDRNGALMDNFREFGSEWQVRPDEHMLFHATAEPQFPKKCLEPEDPRGDRKRRLEESSVTMEQAEKACASLKDELDRKDCVYDVLATQDMDMVGAF
jgi:hypothetical protein